MKANKKVRDHAKESEVYLWELADELDISVETLNRRMRHELPENIQNDYIGLIDGIAKKKGK